MLKDIAGIIITLLIAFVAFVYCGSIARFAWLSVSLGWRIAGGEF